MNAFLFLVGYKRSVCVFLILRRMTLPPCRRGTSWFGKGKALRNMTEQSKGYSLVRLRVIMLSHANI